MATKPARKARGAAKKFGTDWRVPDLIPKPAKPLVHKGVTQLIRQSARRAWSRGMLNAVYLRLSLSQLHYFYFLSATTFSDQDGTVEEGTWWIDVLGKRVQVPLRRAQFGLDWNLAVSILGHDPEVKKTYAGLLGSSAPPQLFLDIGANYGTHSLVFLAHGIRTISFEPNTSCHPYLVDVCRLNSLTPQIEDCALGDREGWAELCFPAGYTWMGTTDGNVRREIAGQFPLTTRRVRQRTVDDYLSDFQDRRLLMKIDTEGSENAILRGATRTLERYRPPVVFESLPGSGRQELFAFFEARGYGLTCLPRLRTCPDESLTGADFVSLEGTNFIARPREAYR